METLPSQLILACILASYYSHRSITFKARHAGKRNTLRGLKSRVCRLLLLWALFLVERQAIQVVTNKAKLMTTCHRHLLTSFLITPRSKSGVVLLVYRASAGDICNFRRRLCDDYVNICFFSARVSLVY